MGEGHTSQRWYLPLGNALMLANSLRRCCSAALSRTLLSRQRVHNLENSKMMMTTSAAITLIRTSRRTDSVT